MLRDDTGYEPTTDPRIDGDEAIMCGGKEKSDFKRTTTESSLLYTVRFSVPYTYVHYYILRRVCVCVCVRIRFTAFVYDITRQRDVLR